MGTQPVALLVDGDPNVAASLQNALASRAVRVDVAKDATSALELIDSNRYCGLVLDAASSPAILRHLQDRSIRVPVVVTATELPRGIATEEIRLLLPKPCEPSLLACTILGLCGIES